MSATMRRTLPDTAVVAMAAAAWVAAWWAPPLGLPAAATTLAACLVAVRRWPLALVGAAALAAAGSAHHAWAGLRPPAPGEVRGLVSLVTDPELTPMGTRAVVRVEGMRAELWARGTAGRAVRSHLAGDRVEVTGKLQPLTSSQIRSRSPTRVVATLDLSSVGAWRPAPMPWRAANGVRRLLGQGAAPLPAGDRALYAGLVLGDDRDQSPALRDSFDAAGMSHLLAVSGQNVAFVLAAASPILRRFRLWPRLGVVLALLAFFALVTRFEPSVLRAVAMAALTMLATTLGRPVSGLRILGLTVTALVIVDPLLVRSLGFQLSVAATAGLVTVAPRLSRPGRLPRPLVVAVAVPVAAQLATAPLLLGAGKPVPLVAVPANVLAEPAAGFVMTWGSSAGLLAGLVPPLAPLIHLPTRLALWWTAAVARTALALSLHPPPGAVVASATGLVAGAVASVVVSNQRKQAALPRANDDEALPRTGRTWAFAALALVAAMVVGGRAAGTAQPRLPVGAKVWQPTGAAVVVVSRPVDGRRLLGSLRRSGVRDVALLVVTSPAAATWRGVEPLVERYRPTVVLGATSAPGAVADVRVGDRFSVATVDVEVVAVWPRLAVDVRNRSP